MILGLMLQSNVAEASEGHLENCALSISVASNGVAVVFETNGTAPASEIGCESVVLLEKINGSWSSHPVPCGHTSGDHYLGSATYTGAVKGATYKGVCVHYGIWDGKKKTETNYTGEMVY